MGIKKDLKYYIGLKWTYSLEEEKHKGKTIYILRVNELPGVVSDGETLSEAMVNIKDALALTIELYLEQGDPIPEPIQKDKFKGNIAYRTTSERHYNLAKIALQNHVSMNKALDMIFDAGLKIVSNPRIQG